MGKRRVIEILNALIEQRIAPYFKERRGTDPLELGRATQEVFIHRFEDEEEEISLVSLLSRAVQGWAMGIHERIFDYLAFVTPLKPKLVLGDGHAEERKIYAFAELMLRHNFEHILYPDRKEEDLIRSDIEFAMDWKKMDPTSYKLLKDALEDELNGIRGGDYLDLLGLAENGQPYEAGIGRIVNGWGSTLGRLPSGVLAAVFPTLDLDVRTRALNSCFKESQNQGRTIMERADHFKKFLDLFGAVIEKDRNDAFHAFNTIKERWGVLTLFREFGMTETSTNGCEGKELFELFVKTSQERMSESQKSFPSADFRPAPKPDPRPVKHTKPKALKERIEEAQANPLFSSQALELIEKNQTNVSGSSGTKYAELIETLLSIPWGSIRRISVSPEEFEEGLNRSHYGLAKPKEILSDFFTNLIWRYQHFREEDLWSWRHTGSAILLVGPPGVGKTSLAISIATNLGIPYHKVSLGGMKDEADIRGYGFTYEGSKPGPIVQGLIKMEAMNGMFILDEADKTEKFAISTLLEILDPEQNHLFHDKYTQSTVDIDLSNAHFVLTANTLETVPPAILDRCEIIFLDRYSVEEKIAIARDHLVKRIRQKYMIRDDEIFFDPSQESDLLRYLVRRHTLEAGVRDLERVIRTLFLRIHRKENLSQRARSVRITHEKVRKHLDEPSQVKKINQEDRIGETMGIGVNTELGVGSLIPIQTTPVTTGEKAVESKGYVSMAHTTGNIEKIMDESRKVALTAILHRAGELGIDPKSLDIPVHLHFMGASTKKDGPSAGGAIALALASHFLGKKVRRDIAMTGEIDTQGRINGIGGLGVKLETAYAAGVKTLIIPKENLHGNGGIERLPEALKRELQILTYEEWKAPHDPFDHDRHVLQVIAVDDIRQAVDIAVINEKELEAIEGSFLFHACWARNEAIPPRVPALHHLRILYVDNPDDVDAQTLQSELLGDPRGSTLLINSELKDAILQRIPGAHRFRALEFSPETGKLSEIIRRARADHLHSNAPPLRISIIAPLAFLVRDGIRAEDFPSDRSFEGLRLFGSFCSLENTRIRGCRGALNRTYYKLSKLDPSALDDCPFLQKRDSIHSLSLSFIPEKYRLDGLRAEQILHTCLNRWLSVIELGREEPDTPQDDLYGPARAAVN
jgi:ATP-dependent Lon protease